MKPLASPRPPVLRGWFATLLAMVALLLGSPAAADVREMRAPAAPAAAVPGTPADHPVIPDHLELPTAPPSFNTHDAGWIRFAYPPEIRERVQPLIREADAFRGELAARLGQPVLDAVHVRVARTPGEMSTLAPKGAPYPRYASGVAYSQLGLVLLTLTPEHPGAAYDPIEVFKHELAHVALFDAVGKRHVVPRWFNEGFAVHASGESSVARLQTLWTATLSGNLMPMSRLELGFPSEEITAGLAYAQSADVVRFLMRREDSSRFSALVGRLRGGQVFDQALEDAYGLDRASLEYDWREDVARRYSFWPVFFSGSLVWAGVLGLFVLGWRRRRRRAQATLERWTREEALEDARRAAIAAAPGPATPEGARIRIVFPAPRALEVPRGVEVPRPPDAEVPKVEHDGNWHTLH